MLRLRDIMTRDVITVAPELSVRDGMELFSRHHISGAPVMTNGKLVGVVSLTDLAALASESPGVPTQRPDLVESDEIDEAEGTDDQMPASAYFADMWDDAGATAAERLDTPETPEWNALEELTIGEAMTRMICDLPSDTPVDEAAFFMERLGIHRVLVLDDGRLVGVVSTKDISDAVGRHELTTSVYVFGSPGAGRLYGGASRNDEPI